MTELRIRVAALLGEHPYDVGLRSLAVAIVNGVEVDVDHAGQYLDRFEPDALTLSRQTLAKRIDDDELDAEICANQLAAIGVTIEEDVAA